MLLVQAHDISFKYNTQSEDLLSQISFRVESHSKIGIVGKNGCGKSTLLQLMIGDIKPTKGHIQSQPSLNIGQLKQEENVEGGATVEAVIWKVNPRLYHLKQAFESYTEKPQSEGFQVINEYEEAGGFEFELIIEKTLDSFGLSDNFLQREFQSLSGGEKTKIGLLKVILTQPSLIVLDEPTNHLDIDTLQWLSGYLKTLKIPYILVSHDRQLLDDCTEEIWELKEGSLSVYSGNYSLAMKEKHQKQISALENYQHNQKKIKKLKTAAAIKKQQSYKMESFKASRSIKKNGGLCKRDEGSASASVNTSKLMKSAKAVENRIHKMIEDESNQKPWVEKQRKITIPLKAPAKSKTVLRVCDLCFAYPNSKNLFSNLNFELKRGERLAIVGKNGSGKSSLLKLLCQELKPISGEMLWTTSAELSVTDQDNQLFNPNSSILEGLWNPDIVEESTVRLVLGSLGLNNDLVFQKIKNVSPGMRSKLAIAQTILSGANVLLLDEPTNHLDIRAREMLEESLLNYEGSVVFISHDQKFVNNIATRKIDIDD